MLQFLAAALPVAASLFGQSRANKAISRSNKPTAAEKRANTLYEALLDPDNPMVKKLQEQYRQNTTMEFLNAIRQTQMADRRAQAKGRAPTFFNPERADETVDYLISRAAPKINQSGLPYVQDVIQSAASGIKGLIPQQVDRNLIAAQQGVSQGGYIADLPRQISKMLDAIKGGRPQFAPMGGSTYSNNLGWIDWR